MLIASCKEQTRFEYINPDEPAPAGFKDVSVSPMPGGAIITYNVPQDPNFLYAMAEYEIQNGRQMEAKASKYNDTLRLEGFGDTLSHEVKIYSVGKNGKRSEPLVETFRPLIPPINQIFRTLSMKATFGGVQVEFENKLKENIVIEVMVDTTSLETFSTLQNFYTGASSGVFAVRGLDTIEAKFFVYLRDRWDNVSDTLVQAIKPLFEEEIPKATWKAVHLPTDTYEPAASSYVLENLWNDNINGFGGAIFASTNAGTMPQWVTIDLGMNVIMSRVIIHQAEQGTEHFYQGSAPKIMEIWASNNPDSDGSWESWDSLGTFHSFKPSGLPLGQWDEEDGIYGWLQGESFEFVEILPPYRYVRLKTNETYGGGGQVVISELDVMGRIVD